MKTHELRLATKPFEAIKSGAKVIESRLFDERRQAIGLGDEIVFTNREQPDRKVRTTVMGLLRYPTFALLFADNEPSKFGGVSAEQLLQQISQFYTPEDERKYGVLGIRIERI